MASPQASDKWLTRNKLQIWDHDPGSTSATVITPDGGTTERWADMRDFSGFVCAAMSSTLNGNGITKLEIVANDESDGSGTDVVIKDSGTVAADAVGDWVVLECTVEELAQEGADNSVDLRYVAGRITVADAADEAVVVYIRTEPRWAYDALTPATTIA